MIEKKKPVPRVEYGPDVYGARREERSGRSLAEILRAENRSGPIEALAEQNRRVPISGRVYVLKPKV